MCIFKQQRYSGIMKINRAVFLLVAFFMHHCYCAIIEDKSHYSAVLAGYRNYRVMLPPDYYRSGRRYPVLYWFHGSGGSSVQTTYTAEFEEFVNTHDLIIVNVDGTTSQGTSWDYGLAFEYSTRTQEGKAAMTGMHFSRYIRELIHVVDSLYRTIPDRDHRATSGQSMGGLMSPWVASQNKDLIGSASMFSPSPDAAMFGPCNKEVCFVNRELYRSLKGIPLRMTMARGDRYRQYYLEQIALWNATDLSHFEYCEVDYPDHRAVGISKQFEFHMKEFGRAHPFPVNWDHTDPFTQFSVWNYEIKTERKPSAFTMLEKVTASGLLISSRSYLPDGPIILNETTSILTDSVYKPFGLYGVHDYNRSDKKFQAYQLQADDRGRLALRLEGGGHVLGINHGTDRPKVFLIPDHDREEFYFEDDDPQSLSFALVNVGTGATGPVLIRATSAKRTLSFREDSILVESIPSGRRVEIQSRFSFTVTDPGEENRDSSDLSAGISLEVFCRDSLQDVQKILFYPVKTSGVIPASEVLVLDGTGKPLEIYNNQTHEIERQTVSGGNGNGNYIPDPGESVLLYVRLPQGLGNRDQNTYHPAFLMNWDESPRITVPQLKYNMKGTEYSGAANLQSVIRINPDTPPGTLLNLWLKCESYEFSEEGFTRPIQRHQFAYCRVILKVGPGK
jgi:hypothetical protein